MYGDRFMSLILGLPYAMNDEAFVQTWFTVTECAAEQLDRVHFGVLGQIVARNVKMQRNRRSGNVVTGGAVDDNDRRITQAIDHELKRAAGQLSLKWWVCEKLDQRTTDVDAIERTGQLVAQVHHYFLLVALHLPMFVQELPNGTEIVQTAHTAFFLGQAYSETTVLAASREVMTRFVTLRDLHRTLSYCVMDDKANIAAVGLVLIHLKGHRHGLENVLDHQRSFDLGLVHKMVGTMKKSSCFGENELGRKHVASWKLSWRSRKRPPG